MGATSSKKKKNRNFTERLFMFFFLLKFQPEHCYVILSAYLDSIVHLFRIRGALSLHWVKIHCCPLLARQHLIASLGRVAVTAHCCRSIDEPFDPKVMLSRSWSRRWLWRKTLALEWMWRWGGVEVDAKLTVSLLRQSSWWGGVEIDIDTHDEAQSNSWQGRVELDADAEGESLQPNVMVR